MRLRVAPGVAMTPPARGGPGVVAALVCCLTLTGSGLTTATAGAEPPPARELREHFDNRGISDDRAPGAADLDGAGNSFSAQDLSAAGWTPGAPLDLGGARLTAPRPGTPGTPDNVVADGQWVRLDGAGDALSLLVAATSPHGPGAELRLPGTVRYADGSRSDHVLSAGDWRGGPASVAAVALPHRNTATGSRAETVRLYAVTVPLRGDRPAVAVRLPDDPGPDADLHVFDLALQRAARGWTGTWAASTSGYTAVGPWTDRTLRLVVPASTGGTRVRVRLANTFGALPVDVGAVSVAVRGAGAAPRERPVPLRFGGRAGVRLPAGGQAVSDPVDLPVPPTSSLLVSLHLPGTVAAAPVHAKALQRSYTSADGAGDLTLGADGTGFRTGPTTWPFLTGVDVRGGPGAVVTLGDSITDGTGSTPGTDRRWPNVLARRLAAARDVPAYGVLNHGISANRVVTDRYDGDGISSDTGGVSAQHRLDRDVLHQPGVRTVVVFEGINDLRHGTSAADLLTGLRAVADRARARGLRVLVATLTPCGGWPDCTPAVERARQEVNAALRADRGTFDAVLDFDAVLRDPDAPERLLPAYDSGDHLHPGDAGLRALGESVDLSLLPPRAADRRAPSRTAPPDAADYAAGSRSTTTGAWSEGPLPLRASRSTQASVTADRKGALP
ncbi:SGNH/GDSL hydrolase family protein [Streptomyces chumphonensis]|uniref:SGNH/GDSL hydrolase family protein n=1 Tax=Streptomyces chumphonensis TaxID=1214925 RepID=A0A927IBS0_9ACTN|nr:SGNH/GDSL hydrolase family protein [Streptomyces chumphonensis]